MLFLRKPLKLYFSAPVDEKTSKVQILKDKKKLRCHFPKSEFGVFGQACIKRPPIMDFSTLIRWTSKEDLKYGSFERRPSFITWRFKPTLSVGLRAHSLFIWLSRS